MQEFVQDGLGKEAGKHYDFTQVHPDFKRRLTLYDPCLVIAFDKTCSKHCVIERLPNGTFNKIFYLQNTRGEPVPPGEWVFHRLDKCRRLADEINRNPDAYLQNLMNRNEYVDRELEEKSSEENKYRLKDDINQWRRAARELDNRPTSDVTAGYPKSQKKEIVDGSKKE